MLKSVKFRKKHEKSWKRLEKILSKVEIYGFKELTPQELKDLSTLYRHSCSCLHILRAISLDRGTLDYLQALTTRGFLAIYGTCPAQINPIKKFFWYKLPDLVSKYWKYHLFAFTVLLASILISFFVTIKEPTNYVLFMKDSQAKGRTPFATKKTLMRSLTSGRKSSQAHKSYFFSRLFTHNTKIGFLTFTLGVALGIPTFFLLVQNGGILGAMAASYDIHELSIPFWAWVAPHGISELLAVILCAGAGFMIASAIILPGKYGRWYHVRHMSKDAVFIVIGTIPMFLLAGIIEGFFRQTALSNDVRFAFALATLSFWIIYFSKPIVLKHYAK